MRAEGGGVLGKPVDTALPKPFLVGGRNARIVFRPGQKRGQIVDRDALGLVGPEVLREAVGKGGFAAALLAADEKPAWRGDTAAPDAKGRQDALVKDRILPLGKAGSQLLKKSIKRHGRPETIVTDKLRSYGAALKELGRGDDRKMGRWLHNRAENSHLSFRRRERALLRFRRMHTLQKSPQCMPRSAITSTERHLQNRDTYKQIRAAALAEWRGLLAA